MTRTLRAHFDGKVFVPEEPVDLPINQPLELQVEELGDSNGPSKEHVQPLAALAEWVKGLPPVERGDLPRDGAAQHDHYLYGLPKQP